VYPKLSQQQAVGEDTDHGWASVGVLTNRNQERQFGMHPFYLPFNSKAKVMRSLILFGLFVFFLVAVQFAQAQTVDEIIDKYIKAIGGKDKLLLIATIYKEGSVQMMGMK